jgi:hypothetical protein
MFEFLTLVLNFSLFLRGGANFSLLCLNFSLLVTFPVKFSLFQPATLPRRPAHYRAGPPNDMVNTMSLMGWRAPADHHWTRKK